MKKVCYVIALHGLCQISKGWVIDNMYRFWNILDKCIQCMIYKVLRLKIGEDAYQQFLQFIKFGLVGLSNTMVSYVVYVILVGVGVNYLAASIVGFLVSVTNSFYWNNKYVFKENGTRVLWKAYIKTFLSYAGTGLVLSNVLLYFWVDVVHIHEMVAPIINLLITIPLNFVCNKLWAFKD